MRVRVDQARDCGAAAEIDDLHTRLFAIDGLADGDDPVAADPDRGHGSIGGIHRQDVAVRQHPVATAGAGVRGTARARHADADEHAHREHATPTAVKPPQWP